MFKVILQGKYTIQESHKKHIGTILFLPDIYWGVGNHLVAIVHFLLFCCCCCSDLVFWATTVQLIVHFFICAAVWIIYFTMFSSSSDISSVVLHIH